MTVIVSKSQYPQCMVYHILQGFIWLEVVFWNPSVGLLYKWIFTVCKNMLYFSELLNRRKWEWAEEKLSTLSWEMNTQGYKKGSTEIGFLLKVNFVLFFLNVNFVHVCVCVGFVCCICKWVTKGEQISSSYMQVGRESFRRALNISSSWWRAWKCLKKRLIFHVKSL